jgi:hypothetical protein
MLHEKLYDPVTKYKASLWEPKALAIQRQANQISSYLKIFEKSSNKNSDQLWQEIQKFKDNLLAIDTLINHEFASGINAFPNSYDSSAKSETFIKTKLSSLSPAASKAYINQLSAQVRMMENRLALFCLEQCPFNGFVYDSYSAIIGQSSSAVRAGEEIKITAGVGAFSRKAEPKITIDGKAIALSDDGAAYYKFKAPPRLGNYTMQAKIEFSDREGKRQVIQKIVEYSVITK